MSTDMVNTPPRMEDFLPDNLPTREREVEIEVADARAKAAAIEVTDEAEAKLADKALVEINRTLKAIEAESKELRQPRRKAADEIKRRYDALKAPFEAADAEIRNKLSAFTAEQERKEREENERLERERQERERIAREARERQEEEARKKAEEAERLAAEAKELAEEEGSEEMQELATEAEAEAWGAKVQQDAIASLPDPVAPARVAAPAPKLNGFSKPKRWVAEVIDFDALPDKLPDGTPLKVVDEVALRNWMHAQVKVNGNVAPELPGAEFKRVEGSQVRT